MTDDSPRRDVFRGTLYGLAAAVGYTLCNACLRAVTDVDPFLVCCLRAIPTVLILGPIVLARSRQGLAMLPSSRVTLSLILAGVLAHAGGNGLFQYALGTIGMATTVPMSMGAMIFFGAIIGRFWLHEGISPRMATALGLITLSLVVLFAAAFDVPTSSAASRLSPSSSTWFLGAATACFAGGCMATLGAVIRHAARFGCTLSQTLTIASSAGLCVVAAICYSRMGWSGIASISLERYAMMFGAGVLNAGAFIALTHALRLTSLVYVQALNATQVTMAAVVGVMLFQEPFTGYLLGGIVLIVLGLSVMRGRNKSEP